MSKIKFDDSMFKYDELKLFFREDYKINDQIIIRQPSIGEIIEYGEKEYYELISMLCITASSVKVLLWDIGQDWNKISDFSIFISMLPQIKERDIRIFFGDFNFDGFDGYKTQDDDLLLYNPETKMEIDEFMYQKIVRYIRKLNGISYRPFRVKGKVAKQKLIEKEKLEMQEREAQNKEEESQLLNLVSAMLVYPGFKYKSYELKECGIYEFMNAVQRAQIIESSLALTKGAYSGFMDMKKVNKKNFNWLRSLDE